VKTPLRYLIVHIYGDLERKLHEGGAFPVFDRDRNEVTQSLLVDFGGGMYTIEVL